jgi:hypothetical protein
MKTLASLLVLLFILFGGAPVANAQIIGGACGQCATSMSSNTSGTDGTLTISITMTDLSHGECNLVEDICTDVRGCGASIGVSLENFEGYSGCFDLDGAITDIAVSTPPSYHDLIHDCVGSYGNYPTTRMGPGCNKNGHFFLTSNSLTATATLQCNDCHSL